MRTVCLQLGRCVIVACDIAEVYGRFYFRFQVHSPRSTLCYTILVRHACQAGELPNELPLVPSVIEIRKGLCTFELSQRVSIRRRVWGVLLTLVFLPIKPGLSQPLAF